jgi:sugar transferase (PEP-CTERM/EpsH1 system associated)
VSERAAPLIVHVIYRLDYGGLENGLVNLINRMPPERFRHAIVCLAGFSEFRQRLQRDDVEVYSLEKRPGKDLRAYWRLWRLLRKLKPAIVHTRNLGTVDLQWIAWAAGVRGRVHGEHGWEASDPLGLDGKNLRIRKVCRASIRRYVAMSQDLAAWLQRHVNVSAARVRQIYNGVDVAKFTPAGGLPKDAPWREMDPKPFVFGTVGRLDPVKRQGSMLEAFARLVNGGSVERGAVRLLIVGKGPLENELKARAEALGVADAVWFTGARSDIPDLMRAMDVFVLPSINEGISNTILEAMACGLAVIAARVGGNPELIVPGKTGVLYDDAASEGLFDAMLSYLNAPHLAQQHGVAGRERVENKFSLSSMVDNYVRVYRELVV